MAYLPERDVGLGGRGHSLVLICTIMPIVGTLLLLNRLYHRFTAIGALGPDDYMIGLSWVFLIITCVIAILAIDYGYGRHSSTLTHAEVVASLKSFFFEQLFYKCSINATKISILVLYSRIFIIDQSLCLGRLRITFQLLCSIMIGIVSCYAIASIIATITQCIPLTRVWDKSVHGTCINLTTFWEANGYFNIVTDIITLLLPVYPIYVICLPRRTKLALIGVFALGIFVIITSILRLTTLDTSSQSADPTYGTYISTKWTLIEMNTAMICANLPMLRTPLARVFPRIFSGTYASTRKSGASGQRRQMTLQDNASANNDKAPDSPFHDRHAVPSPSGTRRADPSLLPHEGGDVELARYPRIQNGEVVVDDNDGYKTSTRVPRPAMKGDDLA